MCGGGASEDQVRRALDLKACSGEQGLRFLRVQPPVEKGDGRLRQHIRMVIYGGQGDAGQPGVEQVIEADDGHILGKTNAAVGERIHCTHCDHIVDGDDGAVALASKVYAPSQKDAGLVIRVVAGNVLQGGAVDNKKPGGLSGLRNGVGRALDAVGARDAA